MSLESIRPRKITEFRKFTCFLVITLVAGGCWAQENAVRNVPSSLLECYNSTWMLQRDNRFPHNIRTLIAIIRKIENSPGLNMDLRTLTVALLHRFRQDGITRNPAVQEQDGVIPYAPNELSFSRCAATLRLIPGNAISFPNSSLTDVERCSLHYMVSSTVERYQRGDESLVCNQFTAQYRIPRNVEEQRSTDDSEDIADDVETLSPEQLETMKGAAAGEFHPKASTVDPSWMYPELPPNHPDSARVMVSYAESSCPVESGVIATSWGPVSAGALLAGIAAALQPQTVSLSELLSADLIEKGYTSGAALDNKWIATFAGDLAEAALIQGPLRGSYVNVGAKGGWNSTSVPKWYFLSTTDDLEMTTAEIRGDLDGLILATNVASWFSSVSSLRLSQVLDMYYDSRGVFNTSLRACNRRVLLTEVAPNATTSAQAYSAALLLHEEVARVTISAERIENFAVYAANALFNYIPASMNTDLDCTTTDLDVDRLNRASVHLSIILDTNWPFATIQPFISTLLEDIEVGPYNSNFTLINAYDGLTMINSTNTILDFHSFNATNYTSFTSGFDLPKAIDALRVLQTERLNAEQSQSRGGAMSDVVLVLSYTSTISDSDKEYCVEQIRQIGEQVPDATFLFLTYGSKDRWTSLAANSVTDTFSVVSAGLNTTLTIAPIVSRIKQISKRLLNSACGATYSSSGSTASFVDYVEPSGINYYRLHPNYFFGDSSSTRNVKIQGSGWGTLNVCTSRSVSRPNATVSLSDVSCTTLTSNSTTVAISCGDAYLIRECQPFYLSVAGNTTSTTSYQCTDASACRFPDMFKYTISYENLSCRSGTTMIRAAPIFLLTIVTIVFNIVR